MTTPATRHPGSRHATLALALAIAAGIGGWLAVFTILTSLFTAPLSDTNDSAPVASTPSPTTAAAPAAKIAAPEGVSVSGDNADVIRIRTFKPGRDALGWFAPVMRLQNVGAEDVTFMEVKVTALRGEQIVATADGVVESISRGQTITTEPVSTGSFPTTTRGITYEVELGG
jgi:hypothetical protein